MLQAPRGTHDILEKEGAFRAFRNLSEAFLDSLGFRKIETPLIETKDLFEKGVGPGSDVALQMFELARGRGEEERTMVLRPEGTAAVVRAYVEHGMRSLPQPVRLYYFGPMFRAERPQRGRFRQFWQVGGEIIGSASSMVDAFLVSTAYLLLVAARLEGLTVKINSLGDSSCQAKIARALQTYFRPYKDLLCDQCKSRLEANPLRILDCTIEADRELTKGAPDIVDELCDDCKKHFQAVLEFLDDQAIPYELDPHLTRGLAYYTRTVYEIAKKDDPLALAGGGRYDHLFELYGEPPTPAAGFAIGVERVLEAAGETTAKLASETRPELYLAHLSPAGRRVALRLLFQLREANFTTSIALDHASLKSQLADADRAKIPLVIIIGQREALDSAVIVRNMLDGSQETVPQIKLIEHLKKKIR